MLSRKAMIIGVVLVLLALVPFVGWPLWKKMAVKQARQAVFDKTKALVDKNPQLKPDWDKAMEDGVLTLPEANAILEKAGEKPEPEE